MVTQYKYYKNSNTNDIIMSQEYSETNIDFPIDYYRNNQNIGIPNLIGYVEISEKKYNRIKRKTKNGKCKRKP